MINPRLFDHYGIDTAKNLGINTICPRPFDTVLIDKQGSCYLCECTAWLPQSVGNLHTQSLENILHTSTADTLRNSVMDKTYRYCNAKQCSWLLANDFRYFVDQEPKQQIRNVRLAIDDSCNLKCPSCRTNLIFEKKGIRYNSRIKLADKINNWLKTQKHKIKVHIGSDGDPFASYVYRYFMQNTPQLPNLKYSILTNGLMLEEFSSKIPNIIENLTQLGISIDGASKHSYEKLRLGGSWQKIKHNLNFAKKLKQQYNFKFQLHFVVQADNFNEMCSIVELGKKYNVDQVFLSRIQNWNTFNDFAEKNIFDHKHPKHTEFKYQLTKFQNFVQCSASDIVTKQTISQLV